MLFTHASKKAVPILALSCEEMPISLLSLPSLKRRAYAFRGREEKGLFLKKDLPIYLK